MMVREISLDYGSGSIMRLVRQHGHRNPAFMQFGQQFRNAGIQFCIVRPAFCVFGRNRLPASIYSFVILMDLGQSPPGQAARAVADKTPVTFNRMCRKAQCFEPGVRSTGNIG